MKIKLFEQFNKNDKLIKTTYQIVTPESAEYGDYSEQGWDNEEGESMLPDDWEDDVTAVDNAVKYLQYKKYTTEPSSSNFELNISYSSTSPDINYSTGDETTYTCFLYGFTPLEEFEIWKRVTGKKLSETDEKRIIQNLKELEIKHAGDIYNL